MKQKARKSREPTGAELREVLPPLNATPEQLARALFRHAPLTRADVRACVRARQK